MAKLYHTQGLFHTKGEYGEGQPQNIYGQMFSAAE